MFVLSSCGSSAPRPADTAKYPYAIYLVGNDSVICNITDNDLFTLTAATPDEDTVSVETPDVERIIWRPNGADITTKYIFREEIATELGKRKALEERSKLHTDVRKGKRKRAELNKTPMALLYSAVDSTYDGKLLLRINVLNISAKTVSYFTTKVFCYDEKGKSLRNKKTRQFFAQARSKARIKPEEVFTAAMLLKDFPKPARANVEIIEIGFSDRTAWRGRIAESSSP